MNEQNKVYTCTSASSTRVRKDTWKKTVSITLPSYLLERTRNQGLNISKVTEQALSSILVYLEAQPIKIGSSFLTEGSFPKETSWAGRSAWYDRHVGIVEVPGSNPGPSTRALFETEDLTRSLNR